MLAGPSNTAQQSELRIQIVLAGDICFEKLQSQGTDRQRQGAASQQYSKTGTVVLEHLPPSLEEGETRQWPKPCQRSWLVRVKFHPRKGALHYER